MYTVRASLGKSEQLFICYNLLNCFNGTDLSWTLKVGCKSFVKSESDIFRFHLLFFKLLAIILKISWVTLSWCFSMLCLSMCYLQSLVLCSLIRSSMQRVVSPI